MTTTQTPASPTLSTPCGAPLPTGLIDLIAEIEATSDLGPSQARQLLAKSAISVGDLLPWADFSHPANDSYGRKLVWQGSYFELMVMSWVDGDMATIHDHGYTQWGAVKFFGRPEHAIFRLRDGILCTAERKTFEPGDVVSVSHDLIHQMGNVGEEAFLSLHFYGCYGRTADITAEARLYELDEKVVQITSGGVFFDLPESEIERREQAQEADFPTTLRHKVELLSRLLRCHGSVEKGRLQTPQEHRLAEELFSPQGWASCQMRERSGTCLSVEEDSRYAESLRQELAASNRLQRLLVASGLLGGDVYVAAEMEVGAI